MLSEDLEAQTTAGGGCGDPDSPLMKRKAAGYGGGRLILRQHLFTRRRITSDYALFFAMLGIGMCLYLCKKIDINNLLFLKLIFLNIFQLLQLLKIIIVIHILLFFKFKNFIFMNCYYFIQFLKIFD